jgi:hypothetical protein
MSSTPVDWKTQAQLQRTYEAALAAVQNNDADRIAKLDALIAAANAAKAGTQEMSAAMEAKDMLNKHLGAGATAAAK